MNTALQRRTFSEDEVTRIVGEARALQQYDLTRAARKEISDHLIGEGGVGIEGNPLSVVYRAASNLGVAREYIDLALQNQKSVEELRRLERNLNTRHDSKQLRSAIDPLLVQVVREALSEQLIGVKHKNIDSDWLDKTLMEDEYVDSRLVFYRRDPILSGDRTFLELFTRKRYRDAKIFVLDNKYKPRMGPITFTCTVFDPDYLEVVGQISERFGKILGKKLSMHSGRFKIKSDYPIDLAVQL